MCLLVDGMCYVIGVERPRRRAAAKVRGLPLHVMVTAVEPVPVGLSVPGLLEREKSHVTGRSDAL